MQLSYEVPSPLEPSALKKYRGSVLIYVNGTRHEVAAADSNGTLLEWLRGAGYTGTKLGCGEGGCGACTVMLSTRVHGSSEVRHAAVNACLMPLPAADWCAITTVEGLGSARSGKLHPVQERISALHGSQCGFCTPGIVMAIYATLRTTPQLSAEELTERLDGNLCRCTGYRPILDAAASLCVREGGSAGDSGCGGGCASGGCGCGGGNGGCGGGNGGCAGGGGAYAAAGGGATGCAGCPPIEGLIPADCKLLPDGDVVSSSDHKLRAHTPYAHSAAAAAEPPLPDELRAWPPPPLHLPALSRAKPTAWWRPSSLAELLALKAALGAKARIVVGASEVTIEARYKNLNTTVRVLGDILSIYICPSIYLFLYLSIYRSIYLSIYPVYILYIYIYSGINTNTRYIERYMERYIYLSIYLLLYLSIALSIYLGLAHRGLRAPLPIFS